MDQNMETKGLGTDIKKITAATGLDKLAKRIAQLYISMAAVSGKRTCVKEKRL